MTAARRADLSRAQSLLRLLAERVSCLPFPCRIVDEHEGLPHAEALSRQGYGLITLMNHFSLRDSLQALGLFFRSPVLRRRPVLAPVAFHQHSPAAHYFADHFAIQLRPVVTRKTRSILGGDHGHGSGLNEYLDAAARHLGQGGILLLAPQGGRQSSLGKAHGRPVGRLLERMGDAGAGRIAFMFVGLSISVTSDYSVEKVGGLNPGKIYQVRIGRTVTVGEAIALVGSDGDMDGWAFSTLRELVPPAYAG